MINRVSTFELRDKLALYLRRVEETETPIIVERRNRPVAVIKPYETEDKPDFGRFRGFLGSGGENGVDFVNRIRRNKMAARRMMAYKKR